MLLPIKRGVKRGVFRVLESLNTYAPQNSEALKLVRRERAAGARFVQPGQAHLTAAIQWIKTAQDASGTDGVPWGYRLRNPVRAKNQLGWVAPYPETTGYIIPTMLRYADLAGDADAVERARRMTAWEMSIQLPDGGIQGGIYGASPVASSTFVTGQVLFGFTAAWQRFQETAVREAGIRAADWLVSCLDDSGRFVRGHSHFCAAGAKAYEVRTAYAMAEFGIATDVKRFCDSASTIANYALSMQKPNGWFAENDLDFHEKPLTHTIGYVLEGLHGIGILLGRRECLAAVDRTLRALVPLIRSDGFLPGRLSADWSAAADWACLTGSSQIAGVFLRRYLQTGDAAYLEAGRKLLGFVAFTQELGTGIPGLDGGIRGSWPVSGDYGQWCVLNWATKFFADSVMDLMAAEQRSARRQGAN